MGAAWSITAFAAAIVGTWWLTGWLVATGVLAFVSLARQPTAYRVAVALWFLSIGVAAPILARTGGLAEVLSILGLIAGYDAAAYVVGTGADNEWEGPAAGVATVVAGSLAVAALADPPFTLFTTGLLALIVSVAGPAGPALVHRLMPPLDENEEAGAREAPAVRRLSTFIAAGPALLVLLALIRL